MMALRDIKIRSARKRKGSKIIPADRDHGKSKRNIKGMIIDITSALDKCDTPFEANTFIYSKCTTSLHHFFKFLYDQIATVALKSHDYVK